MSVQHQFGGDWTNQKLEKVHQYLVQYMNIFESNERAQYLHPIYVDAFAGTGTRVAPVRSEQSSDATLFDDQAIYLDAVNYQAGSAQLALEIPHPFDQYIFVERKSQHVVGLEALRAAHSELNIQIINDDANSFLRTWCRGMGRNDRAVVFLDPYGMAVNWSTVEAIAATKKIDLWVLFPLSMGVNRLLPKKGLPPKPFADALTRFFGNDEWRDEFYKPSGQMGFYDEFSNEVTKAADFESIGGYFKRRLATVFAKVAPNHLTLFNSRNSPLFLLCFAVGNPNKADVAIKIANHILRG